MAALAGVVLLLGACGSGRSGPVVATSPGGEPASADAPTRPIGSSTVRPVVSPTTVASPRTLPVAASASPAEAIDPRTDGLDVTFGEFAITLEAPVIRPGRVTLIIHNAGQLTHGFEMKLGGSGPGGDRKKIETRTFHSGETLRVEADLPPGTYEIECFVADHSSRGMRTTLVVRADAPLVTPPSGTAVPGTARIVQFAFVAASLDVSAGSTVTWTNDDPTPHTVTADDGTFDSKQLDPGASFSVLLGRPGSYPYHCEIHSTMVGTVTVH